MKKLILSIALVMALLVSGCNTNNQIEQLQPQTESARISGEDIFRGVFFLQGNVAKNITSFDEHRTRLESLRLENPNGYKSYLQFVDEIVKEINNIDPTYFTSFNEKMKSGNNYEVQNSLKNGVSMIQMAGLQSKKYGKIFAKKTEISNEYESNQNIDLTDKTNAQKFAQNIKQKYFQQNLRTAADISETYDETCLVPYVAVAVAIWEVAGAVNVITIFNVINTVYAVMIYKAKVAVKAFPMYMTTDDSGTSQEMFINELSVSLQQ